MDISLFADIKPTWEIVAFDEEIDRIPSSGRSYFYNKQNPLDDRVAICFSLSWRKNLFYARLTDTYAIVEDNYNDEELSELLHCDITHCYYVKDGRTCERHFLHAMVIGENLVFRRFRTKISYAVIDDNTYKFTAFPVKEVCRYVFGEYGLIIEKPDMSYVFSTADKLSLDDVYDTLQDAGREQLSALYRNIVKYVKLQRKEDILRTLNRMRKSKHRFGFDLFKTIYIKADEHYEAEDEIPKAIRHDLDTRNHRLNTAVRIDKQLTVVNCIRFNKHSKTNEQVRIYFDSKRPYLFIKNFVTGEWHAEEFLYTELSDLERPGRIIEKDLFDGTCMEHSAQVAAKLWEPRCNRVSLAVLLAVSGFLCAEQALKTDKRLFDVLLRNIYDGLIKDREKTLPEILGITGHQIKYLDNISIPEDLKQFGKCMRDSDFIEHFPDVKKRIFAVVFYLNHRVHWQGANDLTREEVFASARTLNSIERTRPGKRGLMLNEYFDYLTMYSKYRTYLDEMDESVPLAREIRAFGEMPVNMKPSRIHDYHDKMSRITGLIKRADQIVNYTAMIEQRKKEEARSREYSNGQYSILMPKNAEEIIEEGRCLQHCVGVAGYIEAMAAKRCTILFLRDNKRIEEPLITIEERDGAIRQCYGKKDTLNTDAHIRDFIQEYAADHDLRIETVIYSETEK